MAISVLCARKTKFVARMEGTQIKIKNPNPDSWRERKCNAEHHKIDTAQMKNKVTGSFPKISAVVICVLLSPFYR